MITYEVTATIPDAGTARRYEEYMTSRHLRDVLASGCFVQAVLERADVGKYRARYVAREQADVDRYLRDHTAALRRDFAEHFATGVSLSRDVWQALATHDRLAAER